MMPRPQTHQFSENRPKAYTQQRPQAYATQPSRGNRPPAVSNPYNRGVANSINRNGSINNLGSQTSSRNSNI